MHSLPNVSCNCFTTPGKSTSGMSILFTTMARGRFRSSAASIIRRVTIYRRMTPPHSVKVARPLRPQQTVHHRLPPIARQIDRHALAAERLLQLLHHPRQIHLRHVHLVHHDGPRQVPLLRRLHHPPRHDLSPHDTAAQCQSRSSPPSPANSPPPPSPHCSAD